MPLILYGNKRKGASGMTRFVLVLLFMVLFVVLCSLWVGEK
ncbi:hypothetical protein [Allofournierella sp.]